MKGTILIRSINEALPSDQENMLTFSASWMDSFKKRHNFRSCVSHGKSGYADAEAMDAHFPAIKSNLSHYRPEDIFNDDEYGHFFQIAPTRIISTVPFPERKKQKSLLTYLACCNAEGSEEFPLITIGKARNPREFRGKTRNELGFEYYSKVKA